MWKNIMSIVRLFRRQVHIVETCTRSLCQPSRWADCNYSANKVIACLNHQLAGSIVKAGVTGALTLHNNTNGTITASLNQTFITNATKVLDSCIIPRRWYSFIAPFFPFHMRKMNNQNILLQLGVQEAKFLLCTCTTVGVQDHLVRLGYRK
jgi:hypothetical protein